MMLQCKWKFLGGTAYEWLIENMEITETKNDWAKYID